MYGEFRRGCSAGRRAAFCAQLPPDGRESGEGKSWVQEMSGAYELHIPACLD